jgi:pyridoxamine 5'-phosphate oxidase
MTSITPPPSEGGGLSGLRVHYDAGTLEVDDLRDTPLAQFRAWFEDVQASDLTEPNAMILATAGADGQPSARTVLLKDVDARGFVFYSNLTSRKGVELAQNPGASLVFPWIALHRQVVVIGTAELLGRDEVAQYFVSRPRESQLGAWTSRQSSVIEGRDVLDARFAELAARYPEEVPVPDFWGGWVIRPHAVEFWQGRPSRLHDRLRYRSVTPDADLSRTADWTRERLSP